MARNGGYDIPKGILECDLEMHPDLKQNDKLSPAIREIWKKVKKSDEIKNSIFSVAKSYKPNYISLFSPSILVGNSMNAYSTEEQYKMVWEDWKWKKEVLKNIKSLEDNS